MDRSSLVFFLCLGFSFALAQELKPGRVDRVTIGMGVDDFIALYSQEDIDLIDLQLEALFSPTFQYSTGKNPILQAEIDCDYIWRIRVFSDQFKTEKGIGVNSTFDQLKRAYKIDAIDSGETNVFAIVRELSMSFALDLPESMGIEDVPGSTRILWVLVNKAPN